MSVDQGAMAPPFRIVTERFFRRVLDIEIAKAQRLRYFVSVLGLSPDTLTPSDPASGSALARIATMAAPHIRATDIMLVRPPDTLFIMLVDADSTSWTEILARLVGAGYDVISGSSDPGTPGWSVGASCYPKTARDSDDMLRQATDLMRMAHRDGGNRLYGPD